MGLYQVTRKRIHKGSQKIWPGEQVELDDHQAERFADRIQKVQGGGSSNTGSATSQNRPSRYVHHRGGGTYDVYRNDTGERVNSSGLARSQAEALANGSS